MRIQRILYIVALEPVFNSPLIETQVIQLLEEIGQKGILKNLLFLSLVPFKYYFNRYDPFRSFLNYRRKKIKIRKDMEEKGIKVFFVPLFFPFRSKDFYMRLPHLAIFLIQAVPLILYFVKTYGITIIHAISYPASLLGLIIKKLTKLRYIFEMRGLYPEQGVLFKRFSTQSYNYNLWKKLEKRLFDEAYTVITETKSRSEHTAKISPKARFKVVPCCVNTERFSYDESRRQNLRKSYNLENKFVLVYCGQFNPMYDSKGIIDCFVNFKSIVTNTHLLVLTHPRSSSMIISLLNGQKIKQTDFTILNPNFEQIPDLLLMADSGLLLLNNNRLNDTVLSVKLVEYFSVGLPVIVDNFIKDARFFIEKYRCGVAVGPDRAIPRNKILQFKNNHCIYSENSFILARDYFSIQKCAERYLAIYQNT
jgi:glycosyltransferase involved in cell wall biosynthesis